MITNVIKLANCYDTIGQTNKADRLDAFLQKWAQAQKEPTLEDLMKEEEWMQNEDFSDQALLEGLEGDDLEQMEAYLSALQETQLESMQKEEEQKQILDELSNLMMQQKSSPELLPHQQPIMPEASLSEDFAKLADLLDQHGLTKHADFIDRYLNKLGQAEPPDDDDFHDQDFDADLDDLDEPSTEELMKMEEEEPYDQESEIMAKMISFISQLSEGEFPTLEEAVMAAQEVLDAYDEMYGINKPESFPEEGPIDSLEEEPLPDNVLQFPSE